MIGGLVNVADFIECYLFESVSVTFRLWILILVSSVSFEDSLDLTFRCRKRDVNI